jgi:hypothetical protein
MPACRASCGEEPMAHRMYRLWKWANWSVAAGAVLYLASLARGVPAILGWIGLALALLGFGLTVGLRLWRRFRPPLNLADLHHPLAALLPDEAAIPPAMKLVEQRVTSNAAVASQHRNKQGTHARLELYGRKEGVYRDYAHRLGCSPQLDWAIVTIQVIEYQQIDGAHRQLQERGVSHHDVSYVERQPDLEQLGDESVCFHTLIPNDCRPPQILRTVDLGFRRGRYIGSVVVAAVQEKKELDEIRELALRLAREMDGRIQAVDHGGASPAA